MTVTTGRKSRLCERSSITMSVSRRPASSAINTEIRTIPPKLTRYSVRRLDHTHCEEIRLSDLRVRQSPLLGTSEAGTDQTPASRTQHVQGGTYPPTSGNSIATPAGNIGRRSSAPKVIVADAKMAARIHTATRQDRSRVRSAPTSNQGGRCNVLKGGSDVIRFGIAQEIVPRVSLASSPGPSPWPSTSAIQFSSGEGSPPLQPHASYASTLSAPSRRASGSGSRSALEALRAEREAAEAEARQAMARALPNIFPEILVAPPTAGGAGGSGDGMRRPRGWVAGA